MSDGNLLLGIVKQILGDPIKSNPNRGQYGFDCPICSAEKDMPDGDGKGNLEVNIEKGIYHCWVCGETHGTKGTLRKFFRYFANKQQLKKLKLLGVDVENIDYQKKVVKENEIVLPEHFNLFTESNPKSIPYKEAFNYLKRRGITQDIIKKYKIGYTTGGRYVGRIIIPSYDKEGELNYWVGRSYTKQKPKYLNPDADKEKIIFNECCLNWDSDIYLVEGPFDHIVVHNSIPMLGKNISDKLMLEILKKATANIIILLDGGEEEWKETKMIYSKLDVGKLHGRVKAIKLDEGLDVSEINEKRGRQGVIDVMRSASPIKNSLV